MSKTFLITGATKGIGYATAMRLSSLGHQVIGIARHQPETPFPGKVYILDLADETQTDVTFALIKQKHPHRWRYKQCGHCYSS